MGYETIVVGAGSAGAIVAARLSEDPGRQVLLVEAGPDYPNERDLPDDLRLLWQTSTESGISRLHFWSYVGRASQRLSEMAVPRGKVTGGSSAVNVATFIRGDPDDYDSWGAAGNFEWTFERVLPYFRRLETDLDYQNEWHGAAGPLPVSRFRRADWQRVAHAFYESCRASGFPDCPDHNRPGSTGVGPLPANRRGNARISTAIAYLSEARSRANLTISPNTFVRRVLVSGNQATAVEVERSGSVDTIAGGEIVLCAGAIGSPHLLLLSGIGRSDQLERIGVDIVHDLPGVGENVTDHPFARVTWAVRDDVPIDLSAPMRQVGLRQTCPGSPDRNDTFLVVTPFGIGCALTVAGSTGRLQLRSTDPNEPPSLDYRYLESELDRVRLGEAIRLAIRMVEHPDFQRLIAQVVDPVSVDLASDQALTEWLLRSATTSHHISGTCKMGPQSDPQAVVNQYGNLYGLERLRVADASIMPRCVRAPVNATVMMMGERIADFVARGL